VESLPEVQGQVLEVAELEAQVRGYGPIEGEGPWRRYFLVCSNGSCTHWWDRLFKPGFRHCYVLIWEGTVWLYVDPTLFRTHVSILDHYRDDHPYHWIEDPDVTVLEVPVDATSLRWRAPWCFGPLTCTEGCKAILGVRHLLLWTPWRLYRHLKAKHESQQTEEDGRGKGAGSGAGSGTGPDAGGNQRAQAPHPALRNGRTV
jgi:hypothetical protein